MKSFEKQINDNAKLLFQSDLWHNLNENHYICYKPFNSPEVYIRIFSQFSNMLGIGIYTSESDYSFSEIMIADEEGEFDIAPPCCIQHGFIGLWKVKDEYTDEITNMKNIDFNKFYFSFESYDNGFIWDNLDARTLKSILDIMNVLVKVSETYNFDIYNDGFIIIETKNKHIMLSGSEQNFLEFAFDLRVDFSGTEYLSTLKKMPESKLKIFLTFFTFPIPKMNEVVKNEYFPLALIAVNRNNGEFLQMSEINPFKNFAFQAADFLLELSENFGKPAEILSNDFKLMTIIENLCSQSGISFNMTEDALEYFNEDIFEEMTTMMYPDMLDDFDLTDEEILNMSDDDFEIEPLYSEEPLTYKISVSLKKGCYRHIIISANAMLSDLHRAIVDAFGFDNLHNHAFFMDNIAWSEDYAYYSETDDDDEEECCVTSECTVFETLDEGDKFLYIYDFGENWTFQCKVLSVTEGECKEPAVVKSVGNSPEQY